MRNAKMRNRPALIHTYIYNFNFSFSYFYSGFKKLKKKEAVSENNKGKIRSSFVYDYKAIEECNNRKEALNRKKKSASTKC